MGSCPPVLPPEELIADTCEASGSVAHHPYVIDDDGDAIFNPRDVTEGPGGTLNTAFVVDQSDDFNCDDVSRNKDLAQPKLNQTKNEHIGVSRPTQNVPSTTEDVPSTIENVPSTTEHVSSTIENVPSTTEDVPSTIENVPSTTEDVPSTIENVRSTTEDVPSTIENVPSTTEDVPSTIENVPSTTEDVPSTIENVPSTTEHVSTKTQHVPSIADNNDNKVTKEGSLALNTTGTSATETADTGKDEFQTLEDVIGQLGGFGCYQFCLLTLMFGAKMTVSYSVLLMAFAAATPDWWCQIVNDDDETSVGVGAWSDGGGNGTENALKQQCVVNGTQCEDFRFSDSPRTIVSEWDLVCDQSWMISTTTSVQMVGLLVGAAGAGQLADLWGLKNTVFFTLLVQAVFSLAAGFATKSEIFIGCRFFVGLGSGGFVVAYFPLPMEFLSPRWRSVQGAIPTWSFGIGILSLVAWISRDWRWLNWIGAAFSGAFLFAYPFTPESVRWLILHNRIDEAEKVIQKVVSVNRKKMPDLEVIRKVALREIESKKKIGRRYTYVDLLKGRSLIRVTLCFNFTWFSCGLVYYVLSFGAEQLSGSLYLNVFLLTVVEIPAMLLTTVLNNRLGRRWTSFLFFMISCVTAVLVVIVSYVKPDRGPAVSGLVLLCKVGLGAAWPCMQVFATESFPTVLRSVGYGSCNVSSRLGGIIAPYLVLLGTTHFGLVYVIVSVIMGASAVVSLLCPETKGRALSDTIAEFLAQQETRDLMDDKVVTAQSKQNSQT
ncbi:hypothetical protein V1264_010154 [Littorina saxatilis]|uniref:Major facilitator superfamily (MFS) profile domain-containing protein n=2 Tax=Littorina saxatilis TaxID=31220 RepID=A0AAN9ANV2_9CAEN